MVALETPQSAFAMSAPSFRLRATDGEEYGLEDVRRPNGLIVMFICNHCPYVKAILPRILRDTAELRAYGVGSVAIMSNDTDNYPEDNFEQMRLLARKFGPLPFAYCLDDTQDVARKYGAVCTPEFFGFNADLKLAYRGRLDASKKELIPDAPRELFDAMLEIARTGQGPERQESSLGCSIKWKESAVA